MAIFPISFPPIAPSSEWLRVNDSQSAQTSQFSGKTQIIQNYSRWTLDFAFGRMNLNRAEVIAAWQDTLQGSLGTFTYRPIYSVYPVAASLILANPAYATTNEALVSGWGANAPTGLRVGQYIQIGTQLLRINADPLAADGNGQATILFFPALRNDTAGGTPVETTNPVGVFRMMNSSSSGNGAGSGFQIDPDVVPEFSAMSAIEDIS